MENFNYYNPVKIIFGKDTIKNIANEIPQGSKVLVTYGGGSIKKNGVYDQVTSALKGFEWCEFEGIEPNPHYETCMKAVALIKEKNIDFILAVGGGSVIDGTKFIVAAACYEGEEPWDILLKGAQVKKALPFGTVLTLPATGSEMNSGAVITHVGRVEKLAFNSPMTFPKFSVLDPITTFSLPTKQISNGIVDTFVHTTEQYLNHYEGSSIFQDLTSEAILRTLLIEGPKAFENPTDYDIRANLMWASTAALNGWIACGVPQDWATHMIGHELTAFYGLDHGQTLAIVLPGVMTVLKEQKKDKIARMGKEVFGINENSSDEQIEKTIKAVENFFESVGVKTRLSDYGVGEEAIDKIAQRMADRGWKLGECQNISCDVVRKILECRK